MKYYSDITKKFYDTVKECEKAETDYKASKEKEKAAKAENRKTKRQRMLSFCFSSRNGLHPAQYCVILFPTFEYAAECRLYRAGTVGEKGIG